MDATHERITIPGHALLSAALKARPAAPQKGALRQGDPATAALTDFHRESPICVSPEGRAGDAFLDMIRLNIHALLVAGPAAPGGPELLGLITYRRLERHALRSARHPGCRAGASLRNEDSMTPSEELALVHSASLADLSVVQLHRMFQGTGLTHVLVLDSCANESSMRVRGLISRQGVARRCGLTADLTAEADRSRTNGRRPAHENLLIM